jgi:hypothetical protein
MWCEFPVTVIRRVWIPDGEMHYALPLPLPLPPPPPPPPQYPLPQRQGQGNRQRGQGQGMDSVPFYVPHHQQYMHEYYQHPPCYATTTPVPSVPSVPSVPPTPPASLADNTIELETMIQQLNDIICENKEDEILRLLPQGLFL